MCQCEMGGILRNKTSASQAVSARGQDGGTWIAFVLVPVLTLITVIAHHTYTCYKVCHYVFVTPAIRYVTTQHLQSIKGPFHKH
jgi:hypothetical protein